MLQNRVCNNGIKFILSLCIYLFFNVSSLSCQDAKSDVVIDSISLLQNDDLVISATRTERKLSSLPLPTSVVKLEEVTQTGSLRLNEILSEQTGLLMVTDFGGGEGVQLQGLSSDYTLIMIDGLPLIGRQAGTLDLSRISISGVEKLEIIKGPSSALYGSDALAGVINIITSQKNDLPLNMNVSHRLGSNGLSNTVSSTSSNMGKVDLRINADYLKNGGYDLSPETPETSTVAPFSNLTIAPSFSWKANDYFRTNVSYRFFDQQQELTQFISDVELNGSSDIGESNLSLLFEFTPNIDSHTLEFYQTDYNVKEYGLSSVNDQYDFETFFDQRYIRAVYRNAIKIGSLQTLSLGAGYVSDRLNASRYEGDIVFSTPFLYGQYELIPNGKWNVLLGMRADFHSEFADAYSPKVSAYYQVHPNISIKGSIGYGYKAPDFRQLYLDFTNSTVGYTVLGHNVSIDRIAELDAIGQINNYRIDPIELGEDLQPERSVGINLGLNYEYNRWLKFSLNGFSNQVENLIDTRVLAQKVNGQNVFGYYNVGEIITRGLESDLTLGLSKNISINLGYQFLYTADRAVLEAIEEDGIFGRDPQSLSSVRLDKSYYLGLYNRSRHKGQAKLTYDIPNWDTYVRVRTSYRSSYGLFDSNANAILDRFDDLIDGYWLTNVTIGKEFPKVGIGLQVAARNVFDLTIPTAVPNLPGRILNVQVSKTFSINK